MTSTNPADIARALSEDEKLWLSVMSDLEWMYADMIAWKSHRDSYRSVAGFMTRTRNRSLPLAEKAWGKGAFVYRLTPLGLAVRDYLLHRPTASDASTDRTPATVDGCGRKVE